MKFDTYFDTDDLISELCCDMKCGLQFSFWIKRVLLFEESFRGDTTH